MQKHIYAQVRVLWNEYFKRL